MLASAYRNILLLIHVLKLSSILCGIVYEPVFYLLDVMNIIYEMGWVSVYLTFDAALRLAQNVELNLRPHLRADLVLSETVVLRASAR